MNITQTIRQGCQRLDPAYFGPSAEVKIQYERELADSLLDQIASKIGQADSNESPVEALWQVRAVLAPMAQKLRQAMNVIFELDASNSNHGQTFEDSVIEMVRHELNIAFAGEVPSVLHDLVGRVVSHEAADLRRDFDVIGLGRMVRVRLSIVGLLLHRASACLWMMALRLANKTADKPHGGIDGMTSRPVEKPATSADAAAYLDALREFAARLAALNMDPSTLPVGAEAVEEARALCAVRHFVQRRYVELRRWVHPQAAVDSVWTDLAEYNADRGEQLVLQYQDDPAMADSSDPRAWTWQDQKAEEYIFGDMICDLQYAAEVFGIDWDVAQDNGAERHADDIEDDQLARA